MYDICPVCFWEDDPIQNDTPTYTGGANILSLEQSKKNYHLYGCSNLLFLSYCRPPLPEELPENQPQNQPAATAAKP